MLRSKEIQLGVIEIANTVTLVVLAGSAVGYSMLRASDALYLRVLALLLIYLALAYWVGKFSVREEWPVTQQEAADYEFVRYRAGLRLMPHGAALGLIVGVIVVMIRVADVDLRARRWGTSAIAMGGVATMYLYMRYVVRERRIDALVATVMFGGLPIWSHFAPEGG